MADIYWRSTPAYRTTYGSIDGISAMTLRLNVYSRPISDMAITAPCNRYHLESEKGPSTALTRPFLNLLFSRKRAGMSASQQRPKENHKKSFSRT
jgi:hypothetical protein